MSVLHRMDIGSDRTAVPCTPLASNVDGHLPVELVEIVAFLAWEQRNIEHGYEVHGFDTHDWLAAEREMGEWWGKLSSDDIELFASHLSISALTPRHQDVRLRAYFKSQSCGHMSAHEIWEAAENEERARLFSQAFLVFRDRLNGLRLVSS